MKGQRPVMLGSDSHILIVDDDPLMQNVLATNLRRGGFTAVELFGSVPEAFGFLDAPVGSRLQPLPDLILMDMNLGQVNGIDLVRMLKTTPPTADIPVIIIAGDDDADLEDAFTVGALDVLRKPPRRRELLARVNAALRQKHEQDVRRRHEQELETQVHELQDKVRIDRLLGIPDRRGLDELLTLECRRARRHGWPITVLLLDIDYFKLYNDVYGEEAGNHCLAKLSETLHQCARRSGDFIARYEYDMFCIVLPTIDTVGAAQQAASLRRCIEEMAVPFKVSPLVPRITVSIGICTSYGTARVTPYAMLVAAQLGVEKAKANGGNCVATEFPDV
ncbi:MAG: diguanylate cyclase [Herpetosiphon sp.]